MQLQPLPHARRHQKTLWATADKLRANMDAAEYKHLVLGLIFLKYISDTFTTRQVEVAARLRDPADDFYFADATPEDIAVELEDRDYYKAANVFWVSESARWEALRGMAKNPEIGKFIDNTLVTIESKNPKLKGILDKRYARAQLPDGKLGELVDLVSTIGFGDNPTNRVPPENGVAVSAPQGGRGSLGRPGAPSARDILGQVYEYFWACSPVPKASAAGSSTPRPALSKPWSPS